MSLLDMCIYYRFVCTTCFQIQDRVAAMRAYTAAAEVLRSNPGDSRDIINAETMAAVCVSGMWDREAA